MSTTPEGPEYLDASGPIEASPANDNRKRVIVVGALLAVGAVVGVGAWAATSFFSTGAQPAQALPDSTIAYFSVDLDPSGGQKIEAIKTLRKFPGFSDNIDLKTDEDLRERMFEEIIKSGECEGLDYAKDVKPWLGSRAAIAAVDLDEDMPTPVLVVQVSDAGKAEDGVAKLLKTCIAGPEDDPTGWVVEGDWLVGAETQALAEDVVKAADKATLASDDSFVKWTGEAGDDGFMSFYIAKAATQYLDDLSNWGPMTGSTLGAESDDPFADEDNPFADETGSGEVPEGLKQLMEDFDGMAATVRFNDGALEFEAAVSNYQPGLTKFTDNDDGMAVISGLPKDTVAAFGFGLEKGWFDAMVDYVKSTAPEEADSVDEAIADFEEQTGLSLPEDIETLLGDGGAVALGSGIDVDAISNGGPGELPLGVKIKGDADEIQAVLDKLKDLAGPEAAEYLEVTDADGYAVLALNDEFRKDLESKGGLGDNDVYKKVVEGDDAQTVYFINFKADDNWLVRVTDDSPEISENLEPLSAFGVSNWVDGDVLHGVMRVTTD